MSDPRDDAIIWTPDETVRWQALTDRVEIAQCRSGRNIAIRATWNPRNWVLLSQEGFRELVQAVKEGEVDDLI